MRTLRACVVCAAAALCMANPARAAPPCSNRRWAFVCSTRRRASAARRRGGGSEALLLDCHAQLGHDVFRAAAKRLESRGEAGILRLPGVDAFTSAKVVDATRHVEVFGLPRGYCVAQPYATAQHAGFVKWANKGRSSGGWGTVETPQFGTTIVLRLKPSSDAPERRLRYLVRIAGEIGRHCRDVGDAFLQPFRSAVLAEANALASDPVEKLLAARVSEAFEGNPRHKVLRDVLHPAAVKGDVAGMRRMLGWAAKDPFLAASYCPPNESTCMIPIRTPEENAARSVPSISMSATKTDTRR